MGCVITGNQKVNPSVLEDNIRKCQAKAKVASIAQSNSLKRNKRPSIEVSEAYIGGSTYLADSQVPRTESEFDQKDRKFPSKIYIQENNSKDYSQNGKQKVPFENINNIPALNSNPKIFFKGETLGKSDGKQSILVNEKPLICSMGSTAHFASLMDINENNSNFHKGQTKPPSMNDFHLGSNLLTISKHESTKSFGCFPGAEERGSIEEMNSMVNKNTERKTPSLGAVDAVEEVSASREINLKSGDEVCSLEAENTNPNIPSLGNLDKSNTLSPPKKKEWDIKSIVESPAFVEPGKGLERQVLGEKTENFSMRNSSIFGEVVKPPNGYARQEGGFGSTPILFSFANVVNEVNNQIVLENTNNNNNEKKVQNENVKKQSSKKSPSPKVQMKKEDVKAQAKAKFARNLLELVTNPNKENKENQKEKNQKIFDDDDDDDEKQFSPLSPFTPEERSYSLSLMNCLPDEIIDQKPTLLDLKNMDLFGDIEGFSPINAVKGAQGDFTPLMSIGGSTFRRKDSPSTIMEDRTITNVEDNISKFDIDKYSFTAEVKKIEIDEQNNYNVYKGLKVAIPHQPARKSAFGTKPFMLNKSKTAAEENMDSPMEKDRSSDKDSRTDELQSAKQKGQEI